MKLATALSERADLQKKDSKREIERSMKERYR